MDGVSRHPGSRLREYAATHREVVILPPVEGIFRAWIPDPSNDKAGADFHARTEDELLAKLDRALGGLASAVTPVTGHLSDIRQNGLRLQRILAIPAPERAMIQMAQDSSYMSPEEEQMWQDAFRKTAFRQAAERDAENRDGRSDRVDFLLDELSATQAR